jgi:phenylpyruvate tautomerase PptA (4-oxalocrotonate tautomerase family)
MAIISCDIRRGRTDDQKSQLALNLMRAVKGVTDEPIEHMFLVIREMPGFNFVDSGEHVAEYVAGEDGVDVAGSAQLRERGVEV